jgi:hypothetical protein
MKTRSLGLITTLKNEQHNLLFLLANHSQLYERIIPPPPPPPPSLSKSGLKLVCDVNIGYGNLKSEDLLRTLKIIDIIEHTGDPRA